MSEQELKLHVPRASRPSLEKALLRGAVTRVALTALYFDTPARHLMRAKIALRLRLEGEQWVQTLKMPGEHALSRFEINHNRDCPELDLTLYAGTPAEAVLEKLSEPLGICYETQVQRVLRNVRTPLGLVELAYDTGCLRAGGLELPISEIEFELKRGQLGALLMLGTRWQQVHGLILDVRSKAERGDQLAQLADTLKKIESAEPDQQANTTQKAIANFWGPRSAAAVVLGPTMTHQAGLSAVMTECLEQIICNAAQLAEVDTLGVCKAGTAEHVHQLRVGIRRMRSAWSFFNGLTELPPLDAREAIKHHFALLGGTRDDDVLNETLLPILQAAGQPPLILDSDTSADQADAVARDPAFQTWLLDMLAFITRPASDTPDEALALNQSLTIKLRKWHRQVLRDGLRFNELNIEERHALRKRAKRLRYALQFAESLLPRERLRHYRKQLANVQDVLGEMNDLAVARERFVGLRDTQPSAWFACGWITSRLDALTQDACAAFKQLSRTEHFWR